MAGAAKVKVRETTGSAATDDDEIGLLSGLQLKSAVTARPSTRRQYTGIPADRRSSVRSPSSAARSRSWNGVLGTGPSGVVS